MSLYPLRRTGTAPIDTGPGKTSADLSPGPSPTAPMTPKTRAPGHEYGCATPSGEVIFTESREYTTRRVDRFRWREDRTSSPPRWPVDGVHTRNTLMGDVMDPLLWQVNVHPAFDGRPTMLTVIRSDGNPVTQADADRAVALLNWSDAPEPRPQGPCWWASVLLMASTVAMLCAWAWTEEWRWGLTALLSGLAGLVCFSSSLPPAPASPRAGREPGG